jgi:hypothetical protein
MLLKTEGQQYETLKHDTYFAKIHAILLLTVNNN